MLVLVVPEHVNPSEFKKYPSSQLQLNERKVLMQACSQPPLSVSHSFSAILSHIANNGCDNNQY